MNKMGNLCATIERKPVFNEGDKVCYKFMPEICIGTIHYICGVFDGSYHVYTSDDYLKYFCGANTITVSEDYLQLYKEHPYRTYDFLIVGAGLYGCVFANIARKHGYSVLILDKRNHIAGNCYTHRPNTDYDVHKYGAHIFHTSKKSIWDYVNSFVPFHNFQLEVIAQTNGKTYNLPFNMNTFAQLWGCTTPMDAREIINDQRVVYNRPVQNLEERALSQVGSDIYHTLIKGYTEKQWGKPCTELPASIIDRIPLRFTYNNNYFNDTYQGIPTDGYTKMCEKMIEGCDVITNVDFFNSEYKDWRKYANKLVYTGALDEYFINMKGETDRLEWRSLEFETRTRLMCHTQGTAVINYPSSESHCTRSIEHQYFGNKPSQDEYTLITYEFPIQYTEGLEKYYPINDERNEQIANRYRLMTSQETDVIFGGRLAEYKYYDMDKVIERALTQYWNEPIE